MKLTTTRAVTAASVLCLSLAIPVGDVAAQGAKSLPGTWTMVSNTTTDPAGKKAQPFGDKPRGTMVLTADGRYIIVVARPGLPKFASNSRTSGTADENKAIVTGSISHVGKYAVEGKDIVFNIETSTYPNWDGTTQKRTYTLTGDELKYIVPAASTGGTAEVVWKRAK